MYAPQLRAASRKESERIIVAQIRFDDERKTREVGKRTQPAGMYSRSFKTAPVMWYVCVRICQRPAQPLELQHFQALARHPFDCRREHVARSMRNAHIPRCGAVKVCRKPARVTIANLSSQPLVNVRMPASASIICATAGHTNGVDASNKAGATVPSPRKGNSSELITARIRPLASSTCNT